MGPYFFCSIIPFILWIIQKARNKTSSKANYTRRRVFAYMMALSILAKFVEFATDLLAQGKFGIPIFYIFWTGYGFITKDFLGNRGYFYSIWEPYKPEYVSFKGDKVNKKSNKKSNKAQIKFDADDYEGAIIEAKKAIKLDPNNVEAYVYLSFSQYYLEDYSGAIKSAEKGLKIEPETDRFFYILSTSKSELEDYEGALKDIKKAIKIDPNYGTYYNHRASIKRLSEDYKGAIKDYSKAIKLDPENSENFRERGLAKDWSGDLKGAISDWEKGLKLGDEELKEWIKEKNESLT